MILIFFNCPCFTYSFFFAEFNLCLVNDVNIKASVYRGVYVIMDENNKKDEELFNSLGKAKKRKKRRVIITVISIVLVLAAAGTFTVIKLRKKVRTEFASTVGDVVSAQVTTGSINTTVSGSGTLNNVDIKQLSIPTGVDVDEILVNVNETVDEGQLIATVDSRTVLAAMADVQSQIETLDTKLNSAGSDYVNDYISTRVPGRVKKIYAAVGDDVAGVMYRDGALALLSLDGYMAVDVEAQDLTVGTRLAVIRQDGSEINGVVDEIFSGMATVLVTDDGPMLDEIVTVFSLEGVKIGDGALYVHSPLRISGVMGTVELCYVTENQKLYNTGLLFTLTNTEYNNNYNALLKERKELEESLQELLALSQNGGLVAPYAGTICSVEYVDRDDDEVVTTTTTTTSTAGSSYSTFFGSSASSSSATTTTSSTDNDDETDICTICPDITMEITINVDESHILTLEVGQEATVYISSISEDESFNGVVTEISRSATTSNSGVTRYTATISIDKKEQMLAGMSASVYVRIQGKDNALIIPIEALHQTSSTSFVYTDYNEELGEFGSMVEVSAGLSNSSYVEITSGLKEGDTVYYTETENSMFSSMNNMNGMGGLGGILGGGLSGGPSGGFSGPPSGGFSGRPSEGFSGSPGGGFAGGGMPGRG